MADSDCHDAEARVLEAAGNLYQIAALMMGNESEAIELVEAVITDTKIDPCAEEGASVQVAQKVLVESAVERLSKAYPAAFDVPVLVESADGHCIDDDDLSSAGISTSQLASMMSGPERSRLRDWLNKLPVVQRAIFVERAILGWDNNAAAASLNGAVRGKWQPSQVSGLFRQALCSLATSLVHAAAAQA